MPGPYSDSSASGSMPYSSAACDGQLLKAQPVLVAGDLGSVRGVHDLVELAGHRGHLGAHGLERLGAARARLLGLGSPLRGGASDDSAADTARPAPVATARATDAWAARCLRLSGGPLPGGPLGGGRGGERVGPAADRAQPLLDGAHLKARLHLGVARRRGTLGQFLALLVGLQVFELRVARALLVGLRLRELALQLGELGLVLLRAALGRAHGGVEPLGLVGGGPRGPRQPAEPPGDLRRGRVHGLHPAADLLELLPGGLLRLGRLGEGVRRRLAGQLGGRELRRGLVGGGPHVKQRLPARGPAPRPVRPDQVAVGGHRTKIRMIPNECGRLCKVRRPPPRRRAVRATAPASSPAPVTRSTAHRAPSGSAGRARRPGLGATAGPGRGDYQADGAGVGRADPGEDFDRGVQAVHGEGLGGGAEGGGDGLLVAVGDGELGGEGAEHAAEAVRVGEDGGRRVHALRGASP